MIRLIAIIDENRGMGKNGTQPFHIHTDEARFQSLIAGHDVLMGYGTYKAIGHPMKNCNNIVASSDPKLEIPGCQIIHDVNEYLQNHHGDVWVIGGGQIFAATLDRADELYLTRVEGDFDCQVFFPEYEKEFYLADKSPDMEEDGYKFNFQLWKPKESKLLPGEF